MNKNKGTKVVDRSKEVLKKLQRVPKATKLNFCCMYVRHARRVGMEVDEDIKARLVEKALMDREPEAYALLILMKLDEKAYSEAKRLAEDLTSCDWKELAEGWSLDWWVGKTVDAAIVCCLAESFARSPLPKEDKDEMSVLIRSSRPDVADFLDELKNG